MVYQKYLQSGQVQATMKFMEFGEKPKAFYIKEATRGNGKGKPYIQDLYLIQIMHIS